MGRGHFAGWDGENEGRERERGGCFMETLECFTGDKRGRTTRAPA